MNNETLVISQTRLISLIGGSAYPNPEEDYPHWKGPHGPGPIEKTWLNLLSRIALNPQPLPPKEIFAHALAGAIVERAEQVSELGTLLPAQEGTLGASFASQFAEFAEFCGTMGRWELLQKLLAWLRHHHPLPPPPPPEPWWKDKLSENEIIIVGGRVAFTAERFGDEAINAVLQKVGGRLIQQGLKSAKTSAGGSQVPMVEQV